MGAVGHMRGVDSALLFVMAATDDKLLQPKASQKAVQNTFGVTQTMHIYAVHTEPAEEVGNCESPCQRSWKHSLLYEALLYPCGKLEL